MTVTLVVAVAANGVIGDGDTIPWRLPGEQKQFKELTYGHVLVMGRATYDSIGRPLPGRTTVVVTRNPDWAPEGGLPDSVRVAGDVRDAIETARLVSDEVFVIGGAQIYAQTLDLADRIVWTEVDLSPEGDVRFPAVDWSDWHEVSREPFDGWTRVTYERV